MDKNKVQASFPLQQKRVVKISFRKKKGKSTIQALTTVRIKGQENPKSIHLAYLVDSQKMRDVDIGKVNRKVKARWMEIFGHNHVCINWSDAENKWKERREREKAKQLAIERGEIPVPKPRVDREAARRQIEIWMMEDQDRVHETFRNDDDATKGQYQQEMTRGEFMQAILDLGGEFANSLPTESSTKIQEWWEQLELPRLLWCFRRYSKKKHRIPLSRRSFIYYLVIYHDLGGGNLAKQSYLRWVKCKARYLEE